MQRLILSALCLLVLGSLVVGREDSLTLAEVMRTLHGGARSPLRTLEMDFKDAEPDWEGVQESTAEYLKLAHSVAKSKPPRGEQASWDRLYKAYLKDVSAMDQAAKKKDARAGAAAVVRIQGSCKPCHQAHRAQ